VLCDILDPPLSYDQNEYQTSTFNLTHIWYICRGHAGVAVDTNECCGGVGVRCFCISLIAENWQG